MPTGACHPFVSVMKMHRLERKQSFSCSREQLWDFISSPKNLALITPDYMNFKILTPNLSEKMYAGQIIEYYVNPFPFLRLKWVTEITAVKHLDYFIDEQRFGPYKFWHHEHHLYEDKGKLWMYDLILYALPFGMLGELIHTLDVRNRLNQIFDYRFKKMYALFPE